MNASPTRYWPVSPYYPEIEDVDVDEIVDDGADGELWHVQVEAGDVRVVSLDKLDDLFRFGVIDENVFVWQTGMSSWVRLATLLGASDPESDAPFHVLFSPGNIRTLTLEQLDEFYRHSIVDEGTLIWRDGMPEWQTLGRAAGIDEAVLSQRPISHLPPRFAQPGAVLVPSAPPVAFSIEPYQATRSGGGGRWLVRLTIAAGAILALFRNDLIHAALQETPLAAHYDQAERSLFGGPIFGTTRSVERLVTDCGGHLPPVRLPIAVTQFTDAQKRDSERNENRNVAPLTRPKDVPAQHPRVSPPPAATASNATTPTLPTPAAGSIATLPARDAVAPGSVTAKASAPASKPATSARPAKRRTAGTKSGVKAGGSYYDPLNGAL